MATIKSIEEKAKAYDEAIEKLRSLHDDYDTVSRLIDVKEELANLFPALKESEDKDKRMIRIIENAICTNEAQQLIKTKYGLELTDLADWLEKQGEHDMGIPEATKQKLEDNLNKALEKETPESFNKFLDEQKPADNAELSVFKDKLLELFQAFRWKCKDHVLTNGEILDYVDAHIQELIDTTQKPAWSEEDDIMAHDIDYALRCQITYPISRLQSMSTWIDNLKFRVQPQQQQEWSEEDENVINHLLAICAGAKRYRRQFAGCLQEDITKYQTWLKSLRPQNCWKPSDEQMRVLDLAIRCGINRGTTEETTLVSLFNDLKKLKE